MKCVAEKSRTLLNWQPIGHYEDGYHEQDDAA